MFNAFFEYFRLKILIQIKKAWNILDTITAVFYYFVLIISEYKV